MSTGGGFGFHCLLLAVGVTPVAIAVQSLVDLLMSFERWRASSMLRAFLRALGGGTDDEDNNDNNDHGDDNNEDGANDNGDGGNDDNEDDREGDVDDGGEEKEETKAASGDDAAGDGSLLDSGRDDRGGSKGGESKRRYEYGGDVPLGSFSDED